MAYDAARATNAALSKLSEKYDKDNPHLVELVRAIMEAIGEEVPQIQDVGGSDPSPSHQ